MYSLPGIVIGLTAHEYCHALAACRLGDFTAREQGRMSFNPLKHIDLIGFLFIIFAGFGWAKPVQFNPENLSRPRRDKAVIAAAGPLSNLALAFIFIGLVWGWLTLARAALSGYGFGTVLPVLVSRVFVHIYAALYYGAMINMGLFIFNLLPIPPLDGSHIVFSGLNLSPETERNIMKIGAPLLFIILIIQNRLHITILPIGEIVNAIVAVFMPGTG
jgi:Zn-dependent protease